MLLSLTATGFKKMIYMRLSILFCLMISFFCCQAQKKAPALATATSNNTLLWEVSGKGLAGPSYIFGTFHLMCKTDIRFSGQLKQSLANADKIYMELDMDDPAMMLGGVMMMNMKGGVTLKDLYTEAAYNKINAFFTDSLQLPLTMLQSIKPYFLVAMLYPKMMPCKTTSGVEEELMKLAKKQKKEIRGLETLELQSAVFDSIPYAEQAKELLKSIDSLARYREYFDLMVQVYKSQQLEKMETLFNDKDFGMEEYQDILLDSRNKNWVQQLKGILKKERVFVAVGAGHLPGKKGLLALLREAGYTVKPLPNIK
jgi:uncharacterized protein